MSKNKIFLILLLLFAFSCRRKDLPEPTYGSPVLFFKGVVNNAPFELDGGVGGYYLSTSYSTIQDSIYSLTGYLKQQNCTANCPNSLNISIADYKNRKGAGINDIGTVLKSGAYSFLSDTTGNDTTQLFQFNAPGGYKNYSWSFGDGATSTVQNPTHTFTQNISSIVCLTVSDSGCSNTSCDTTHPASSPLYDLSFTYVYNGQTDSVSFIAPNGWSSYSWTFGDSNSFVGQNPEHIYSTPKVYNVSLTATKLGVTRTYSQMVAVPEASGCTANWTYSSSYVIKPVNNSAFSGVTIQWTDANGNNYISSLNNQPISSYFNITAGGAYLNNAANQKTYKFNCNFEATLYQIGSPANTVQVKSNNSAWSVAYP